MTFPLAPGRPADDQLPLHHIENHAERALDLLLGQFKQKPVFETVCRIYLELVQELENVFWDLRTKRALATAEGEQLDVIGHIVAEPRGPLGDDDYRAILGIKILVLRSSGTAPELMTITQRLVGDNFRLTEHYPAAMVIEILGTPTFSVPLITRFLKRAKSGGVRLDVSSGADPLRFASVFSGGGHGAFASVASGGGSAGFAGVS